MRSRGLLLFLAAWTLSGGLARDAVFVSEEQRLFRWVCSDQWWPSCLQHIEQERERFYTGLRKNGYADQSVLTETLLASSLEAEKRYGVDYRLVVSMALVESTLRPDVVSDRGARGLLQILPETAQGLWPAFLETLDPRDPLWKLDPVESSGHLRLSVLLGAFYVAELAKIFQGESGWALASYNVGPTRLKQLGRIPGYGKSYVRRIYKAFRRFPQRTHRDLITAM